MTWRPGPRVRYVGCGVGVTRGLVDRVAPAARGVVDGVAAVHGLGPAPWFLPRADHLRPAAPAAGRHVHDVRLVQQRRHLTGAGALESWLRSQVLSG